MHPFRGLILAVALLLASPVPGLAQSVTPEARERIQTRISSLEAVIEGGDLAGALAVVPPRLLRAIATKFGVAEADLMPAMRTALESSLSGVRIEGYAMDLAAADVAETPDGARTYLLIPTHTVMQVEGAGRVRTDNQTLALEDDGEWYLIRIDDAAQAAMVREVYPEFATVQFPAGTTARVD